MTEKMKDLMIQNGFLTGKFFLKGQWKRGNNPKNNHRKYHLSEKSGNYSTQKSLPSIRQN